MELTAAQRIRAEAKEATRRALLRAGVDETIRHGGVVPSIETICANAGFTRGAFYVHFESRDDFVVQMLEWVVGDIFQTIFANAGEGDADLRAIVGRFTDALVKREWPDVSDIRSAYLSVIAGLRQSRGVQKRHADLMSAAVARLEQAIREGQEAGQVRGDLDAHRVAELLLILGIGLIVWDDVGIPLDATALGDAFLDLVEGKPER
jgi:AcrR family transcriptional regulator